MKRSSKKITRQISAIALGLISIVALMLSSGLIMYTGSETVSDVNPPLTNPVEEEIIHDTPSSTAPPGTENSLAALTACILVVLAFVLVWFLVFRPEESEPSTDQDLTPLIPQKPYAPSAK